jgi:hypothetical protein
MEQRQFADGRGCGYCGSRMYEVHPGVPLAAGTRYSCAECTIVFKDPDKFARPLEHAYPSRVPTEDHKSYARIAASKGRA